MNLSLPVHRPNSFQGTFRSQASARADPAEEFIEIALCPALEEVGMLGDHLIDCRAGSTIETPVEKQRRVKE